MVYEIPENDWGRNVPGEAWAAKEEMVHIIQALEVLPKGIRLAVHDGKRSILSNVPSVIRSWVNGYLVIPILAKWLTRESVANAFENAYHSLVEILEKLPEEDWKKGTRYPRQYRTVEQIAHRPKEHFDEHAPHLCNKLGIGREGKR